MKNYTIDMYMYWSVYVTYCIYKKTFQVYKYSYVQRKVRVPISEISLNWILLALGYSYSK